MSERENALVGAVAGKLTEVESAQLFSFTMGLAGWLIFAFMLVILSGFIAWLLYRQREAEQAAAAERRETARTLEIMASATDRLAAAMESASRKRARKRA